MISISDRGVKGEGSRADTGRATRDGLPWPDRGLGGTPKHFYERSTGQEATLVLAARGRKSSRTLVSRRGTEVSGGKKLEL